MANSGNGQPSRHGLENTCNSPAEKLPGTSQPKPFKSSHPGLSMYMDTWRQTDEAGSHLLYSLCNLLAGSQYEVMAKEIGTALGRIYANSESELVLSHVRDIDSLMSGLGSNDMDPKKLSPSQHQTLLRCLLLLVRLEGEFHQMCSDVVSRTIEHLVQHSITQDSEDILHQIASLELHKLVSASHSPDHNTEITNYNTQTSSSSPKMPKHGLLKSALFSLFDRKNSPEDGKSCFYVPLSQSEDNIVENSTKSSQSYSEDHVTTNNQSETLIHLGLDPSVSEIEKINKGMTDKSNPALRTAPLQPTILDRTKVAQVTKTSKELPISAKGVSVTGDVASQEELDSVINLLSGVTTAVLPMQTIPEHQDQLNLQVPSMYSAISPSASDSAMDELRFQHAQEQRRSEGSLDFSGFGNPGRNTWPNKHRSSLPGGNTNAPVPYEIAGTAAVPRGYPTEARPAMTLPPGLMGQFPPGYQWAFPDPKLNRTWPLNNLTTVGSVTDTLNSSWSGAHDSDDLSDDSSCGDQFSAMSQRSSMDPRREVLKDESLARMDRAPEGRHHSLEDLLDVQSTTMWPSPVQPWSQPSQMQEPVPTYDNPGGAGYHRPVQMQWSDPLSNKHVWPIPAPETQNPPVQSHSAHGFGQK